MDRWRPPIPPSVVCYVLAAELLLLAADLLLLAADLLLLLPLLQPVQLVPGHPPVAVEYLVGHCLAMFLTLTLSPLLAVTCDPLTSVTS